MEARNLRTWWAAGATLVLIGGVWVTATSANANPLSSGSHHHHSNAQAGAGTGAAAAGNAATGNGIGDLATSTQSMQSHTNVMQEWTPPSGSANGATGSNGTTGASGANTNANANAATVAQATSTNWSGYADTGGKYTSVAANWTQPTVTCGAGQTFSSYWVGLDGDGTASVEQTGSEADCQNGTAVNFGWFEMFPAAPVEYNKPVAAGDAMSASVTTDGAGAFTLTLNDQTQGWNQVTTQTSNTAQLGSAEVVAEAPTGPNGVLPLTNFGTVNFTNATANGAPIGNVNPSQLTMVSAAGVTEASASALTANENFAVTWASA